MQFERESLLSKGKLYNDFYRAELLLFVRLRHSVHCIYGRWYAIIILCQCIVFEQSFRRIESSLPEICALLFMMFMILQNRVLNDYKRIFYRIFERTEPIE